MKGGMQAPKLERKTVEKNRRQLMNRLLSKLSSVIHKDQSPDSKDGFTKQGLLLEEATSYIKKLRGNIERLNQERNGLEMNMLRNHRNERDGKMAVQVQARDACLGVVLISGLNKNCKFYEVIGILEEEGAEVIHASFSRVEDKIVNIIHSQAISSRIGIEEKMIKERLEGLV